MCIKLSCPASGKEIHVVKCQIESFQADCEENAAGSVISMASGKVICVKESVECIHAMLHSEAK